MTTEISTEIPTDLDQKRQDYIDHQIKHSEGYTAFSNADSFEEYEQQLRQEALASFNDPNHTLIDFPVPTTPGQAVNDNTAPNLFRPEIKTSMSNALFVSGRFNEEISYLPSQNTFRIWTGKMWIADHSDLIIERFSQESMQLKYNLAQQITDDDQRETEIKWVENSLTNLSLKQTIHSIKTLQEHWKEPSWFNYNSMLLPANNCAIDLKTKEFFPHAPSNRNTTIIPIDYDPSAACPIWLEFLDRIFNSDQSIIQYLQRVIGYALTGETTEQSLFFLYGTGSNGKSTFLETIGSLMGEYFKNIPIELLLKNKSKQSSDEIARLAGARFVTAKENDQNERLDESMIKALTGGDTITGRHLYKSSFDFKPQFKLFIGTNHKPKISGQDHGIWRRIKLIPFTTKIPDSEKDLDLSNKLRKELPGILNWALTGCIEWQKQTLNQPDIITEETNKYKADEDILSDFIYAHILASPNNLQHSKLMIQYKGWCIKENINPQSSRRVAKLFKERNYAFTRNSIGLLWTNLALNTHAK